jgi:hypothetical protein
MSIVLAKKLYFDIYNLENDLKNKQQTIREYQELFEEYIMRYKEENKSFADTYNEIESLNKQVIEKEFARTINDIDVKLNNDNTTTTDDKKPVDSDKTKSKSHPESITKNYRDIVKKTHPDMTSGLDEKTHELYGDFYKKATLFYDNNELYGLMLINKILGNNPFNINFVDTDIDNLKEKKNKIESEITEVQNTFIWNFMNIEDEIALNEFIANHFKNMLNKMK